jgi:hypothetical protein
MTVRRRDASKKWRFVSALIGNRLKTGWTTSSDTNRTPTDGESVDFAAYTMRIRQLSALRPIRRVRPLRRHIAFAAEVAQTRRVSAASSSVSSSTPDLSGSPFKPSQVSRLL